MTDEHRRRPITVKRNIRAAGQSGSSGRATWALFSETVLRFASGGLGIISVGLLTRSLVPAQLGFYSLWTTIIGLLSTFAELAQRQAMLRDLSRDADPDELGRYVFTRIVYTGCCVVLCLGVVVLTSSGTPEYAGALVVMSMLVTPVSCLSVVLHANLRGDLVGVALVIQSAIWAALLGVTYSAHLGLIGVSFSLIAANSVPALFIAWRARAYIRLGIVIGRWEPRGSTSRSQALLAGSSGATLLAWKIDLPIVYGLLSQALAGRYAAAYRILDQTSMLPSTLASVMTKRLARASDEQPGGRAILWLSASACCGAPIVFLPLAPWVARALFGGGYEGAASIMTILIAALPLVMLRYLWTTYFILDDAMDSYAITAGLYLVTSVSAVVVAASLLGVRGAALATTLAEATFTMAVARSAVRHALRSNWKLALVCAVTTSAVSVYALTH